MTAPREIDHMLAVSIQLQGQEHLGGPFRCGCEFRGKRWQLCSYHEGFADALDASTGCEQA